MFSVRQSMVGREQGPDNRLWQDKSRKVGPVGRGRKQQQITVLRKHCEDPAQLAILLIVRFLLTIWQSVAGAMNGSDKICPRVTYNRRV
jgi:hypothetical protein